MKPSISHTKFIQACRKIGLELDKKDKLLGKAFAFIPKYQEVKHWKDENAMKLDKINWFYVIFPPNNNWTPVAFRINYEFLTDSVYLTFVLQKGDEDGKVNKKLLLKKFMELNDKTIDIGNIGLQTPTGRFYNFWKLKGSEVSINEFINNTEAVGLKYSDLILENFELIKSFLREGGVKVNSKEESLNSKFFNHTF